MENPLNALSTAWAAADHPSHAHRYIAPIVVYHRHGSKGSRSYADSRRDER
jgi:hypothetical protein